MTLRLLQVKLPDGFEEHLRQQLADLPVNLMWSQQLADGLALITILTGAEVAEAVLDRLQEKYGSLDEFSVVALPVEAILPRRVTAEESEKDEQPAKGSSVSGTQRLGRIGREELWQDIQNASSITWIYVALVLLSALVASLGLLKDNVAIVIGAMVIAPLLGPSMALALATTLGDGPLARRSLLASGVGLFLGFGTALILGLFLPVDANMAEIASRTKVGLGDLALAIASGAAGALAFTSGVSSVLVGVMVAVALMPPLVATGLLLGAGFHSLALGAFLLLMANLICVNLAGVVVFRIQGVAPSQWAEADHAKKTTVTALVVWAVLLVCLVLIISAGKLL